MCIDYAKTGEDDTEESNRTMLIGRDRWTKNTFSHLVTCKGCGDKRIIGKTTKSIDATGNTRMILKGDGEPALVAVQDAIKANRPHDTVLENPPAHDPQSNGEAERAVQEVKAQMRAIKFGLESRIKANIGGNPLVFEWIIPHASDCISRFLVGKDGRTPHSRICNKHLSGKTFEFGEQVLAKPKRGKRETRKQSMKSKWHDGTWAGFGDRSHEHIVVLTSGGPAIKVRTVRPKAESERWRAEEITAIVATPDAQNPKDPQQECPRAERDTRGPGSPGA